MLQIGSGRSRCSRLQRLQAHFFLADLNSNGFREGSVDDCNYVVIVFGKVVEEYRVADAAIVVCDAGGLYSDCSQELFLISQTDEREPLFNGSLKSCSIGMDVTQQSRKFSGFQYQFAQRFVAQ